MIARSSQAGRRNPARSERGNGERPSPAIARVAVVILVIAVVLGASILSFFFVVPKAPAKTSTLNASTSTASMTYPKGGAVLKAQLNSSSFDAITEYALPGPVRSPNSITVAPDGSVWFAEEALPGVAHLFPNNGTLVEYAWPFDYGPGSTFATDIWGIALWNGSVWASDAQLNQIVAVNPATAAATAIHLPTNNSFPYTLTVGPDNSLWFTELDSSKIGRILPNGTLIEYKLSTGGLPETPVDIEFLNSTLGYYVTTAGIPGKAPAGLYSFNPQDFSPSLILGNQTLSIPSNIALEGTSGIWVDLHGPSMVGFYNPTSGAYALYPTSTINYTNTALAYFIRSNDSSSVWFNEHYGNRIAMINLAKGTLTEYSESNPPVYNSSLIVNALTFALGQKGAWFTAITGNFIGYVNASYIPNFSVTASGNRTIQLRPGQEANITIKVTGTSSSPLSLQYSDSESFTAVPKNITFTSNVNGMPSPHSEQDVMITIKAGENLAPGNYTLLVTVNGGLIRQSVYLTLEVVQ